MCSVSPGTVPHAGDSDRRYHLHVTTRSTDPVDEPPGHSFERRVRDAYRALGYQVDSNLRLRGQQVDLVARRDVPGAPPVVLAVECKDQRAPLGNQAIQDFVATITALRASSAITAGVCVSASGFTADAHSVAWDLGYVTLLSWDSLTAALFASAHALRTIVDQYESTVVCQHYLPLAVASLSWETLAPTHTRISTLEHVVDQWLPIDSPRVRPMPSASGSCLFILADFGAGKTTSLRYLEYKAALSHLNGDDSRLPLFVPLRAYRDTLDVNTLIRSSFRDAYYRDIPSDILWQQMDDGRFVILLDGFDEMVDRSDAKRRVELFHDLLPLFHCQSPTILTSRPSYFVERGELDGLLANLRHHEIHLGAERRPGHSRSVNRADELRRTLVERHREVLPKTRTYDGLDPRRLRVVQLLPLDRARIEKYIQGHSEDLRRVRTTPQELQAFVDDTYDLTEIATRPLLLTLIVDSVLIGGLAVRDAGTSFGPSALYEAYTDAKLDLDFAKGDARRHGLSTDVRRELAQALAVAMYRDNVLETDFESALVKLLGEGGSAAEALATSDMSHAQVATDFATCSFITLDEFGRCRFIHKSFRGFFVAQVIKGRLAGDHPLLSDWLEGEILYFIGGFAPTEPRVRDVLWTRFQGAAPSNRVLRRNMLAAYLFTQPEHPGTEVVDAEIADVAFARLELRDWTMSRVKWTDVSLARLALYNAIWSDAGIERSSFDEWLIQCGHVEVLVAASTIRVLELREADAVLETRDVVIDECTVIQGRVDVNATSSTQLKQIAATRSELTLAGEILDPLAVGAVGSADSRVTLADSRLTAVKAKRSVIWRGRGVRVETWTLEDCVVFHDGSDGDGVPEDPQARSPTGPSRHTAEIAGVCVVLGAGPVSADVLGQGRWGVFGRVARGSEARFVAEVPSSWGVLAMHWGGHSHASRRLRGFSHGDMLFVDAKWFDREVGPRGRLSAIAELQGMVEPGSTPLAAPDLAEMLRAVQEQYREVMEEPWPLCGE